MNEFNLLGCELRPQVVWPNGLLASTVGLAVELIANWTRKHRSHTYLVYDGNAGTLQDSHTLRNLRASCRHYSTVELGDSVMVEL